MVKEYSEAQRRFLAKQGYRPVVDIDGEFVGMARTEYGARLCVVRGCRNMGVVPVFKEIEVSDEGALWRAS